MAPAAPTPAREPARRRLALVIGSGSIKCAASLGLWKVLRREGIAPDLIVGCSGGSIFAALMAMGCELEVVEEWLRTKWTGALTGRPHYRSVLRAAFPRLLGFQRRFGLLDDRGIMAAFRDLYGDRRFSDLPVPLFLAATDMETGERVVISDGEVADAVRASIALPVLLRPWPVDGRLLVDGGTSDPLPISVAIREGSDIIIAMGFENTYDTRLDTLSRLINQHLMISINHLVRSTFAFYSMAHHAEVIPVMPVFDRPLFLGDVDRFPYIVEQGVVAAEEQIGYLKRLLNAG